MKAISDRRINRHRQARKGAPPVPAAAAHRGAPADSAGVVADAGVAEQPSVLGGAGTGRAANAGAARQASGAFRGAAASARKNGYAAVGSPTSSAYGTPAQSPMRAFLRSFVFAGRGLAHAVRTQRNARVHALIAAAAIALGVALRISAVEFAVLFVAITLVFVAEMFNTVAEACVDMITDAYHPLAQIAKDVAAGAVLLNAMLSVVIGLFVFVPHLWPLVVRWLGW